MFPLSRRNQNKEVERIEQKRGEKGKKQQKRGKG